MHGQISHDGSSLIIPREGGYLFRLYIELDKLGEHERVADRGITPEYLIARANRIYRPYKFEVKEIAWWSVYEIGQRIATRFDNSAGRPIPACSSPATPATRIAQRRGRA